MRRSGTRIVAAASELFTAHGFGATTLDMVAKRAGVSVRAVGRLVGDRHDLLVEVLAERSESVVADLVEQAAETPDRTPPLSALIEAAHRLQEAPEASWDSLELEVLARARDDAQMRTIGTERIAHRSANVKAISASSREAGGLDPELSDNAVVHLSMALSIGLAMLDPVATHRPTPLEWDAMIARIGAAVAPSELLLQPAYEVSERWRVRVDIPDRPGGMSRIIRALGALHVYTVSLGVVGHGPGTRTVDLSLIAPPHVSAEVILAAAESAGEHAHITVGSPDAGRDLPTRMLDAATFLVKHPEAAPTVAAGVVEADNVEVIAATEGADDRSDVLRLQWTADRHVLLQRNWAPFAGAEQARASALLRLSSAIARISGDGDVDGLDRPGPGRHGVDPPGPARGCPGGGRDARTLLGAQPVPAVLLADRVARHPAAPAGGRASRRDAGGHESRRRHRRPGQRVPGGPGRGPRRRDRPHRRGRPSGDRCRDRPPATDAAGRAHDGVHRGRRPCPGRQRGHEAPARDDRPGVDHDGGIGCVEHDAPLAAGDMARGDPTS